MPSDRVGPHVHYSRILSQLPKTSLQAGYVVWLCEKITEDELITLIAAGMNRGALNHPVVVVDMLKLEASKVEICLVTSLGGKNIIRSNINQRNRSSYLPIYPADPDSSSNYEQLRLENGARMRKNSYVNTRSRHQIPVALLQKYDRSRDVSSHCLMPKSLEVVRAACGLDPLRFHGDTQRPAGICAMPESLRRIPAPPTGRQSCAHIQGQATANTVGLVPRPSGMFDTEQQPLLPAVVAGRSQAHSVKVSLLKLQAWQECYNRLPIHRSHDNDVGDTRTYWPTLKVVFACLMLCTGVSLLALLGYGMFLGVTWLAHSFGMLLIIIKADIAAGGHYIAGRGGTVASPFITVGKGVAAFGQAVPRLAKAVVRWTCAL